MNSLSCHWQVVYEKKRKNYEFIKIKMRKARERSQRSSESLKLKPRLLFVDGFMKYFCFKSYPWPLTLCDEMNDSLLNAVDNPL